MKEIKDIFRGEEARQLLFGSVIPSGDGHNLVDISIPSESPPF